MDATRDPEARLDLATVLAEEYAHLRPEWCVSERVENAPKRHPKEDDHTKRVAGLYWVANDPPDGRRLAALCLSGGGIRSATFNLGVIQALAGARVLRRFDYLSSVSGGGYVASWLQGWLHRAENGATGVARLDEIGDDLKGARQDPIRPEARAIRHLREYSNYLTPQLGLLSVDTWTAAAIIVRNILLNWLVLIPLFAAMLALPLLAVADWGAPWLGSTALFVIGCCIGLVGLVFMNALRSVRHLEGFACPLPVGDADASQPKRRSLREMLGTREDQFIYLGLIPLLVGVAYVVAAIDRADLSAYGGDHGFTAALWPSVVVGGVLPVAAFLIALPLQKHLGGEWPRAILTDLGAVVGAGCVETIAFAFMLSHWASTLRGWSCHAFLIVAPTLLLAPMLLGKSLFVAFSSLSEGKARPSQYGDAQREWWARWSAWICIALVTWMTGSAIVYLTPWLLQAARYGLQTKVVAAGGSAAFLGSLISYLGKSELTPAKDGKSASWTQLGLNLGVPVFCLLVAMLISYGTQAAIADLSDVEDVKIVGADLVTAIVVMLAAGLGMGWCVNVNRFSLHAFYRNRLVRCYLGASNIPIEGKPGSGRHPNFFTGFDPSDNVRLCELRKNRPMPVINMALNLVSGANLAWQERKADSFTATPLHCGNAALGYRRTECYGGQDGMSLGTAVAISGAAASPNMGYNSSPAVAFVMALFNARLGAWLGNPGAAGDRKRTYRNSGPGLTSPYWLLAEAFGGTDQTTPYVNLSDGGHFDNLGLYEMVRRRCGFILICDAGQDLECRFDDLGIAIRNVRVDLGVSITFDKGIMVFPKELKERDKRAGYCAIGAINYGDVDGKDAPPGVLIYLKPAICEDEEPYDVYNYARASKDFPHESTADQWFSESQFEAYRILGNTAMRAIMDKKNFVELDELRLTIETYLKRKAGSLATTTT